MELDEIKKLKYQASKEIAGILSNFERLTGVLVKKINVSHFVPVISLSPGTVINFEGKLLSCELELEII